MLKQRQGSMPTVDTSTRLSLDRTPASYERTMMSWIRTATSLITFGLSIYKFFQLEVPNRAETRLIGPREFALVLVSIGMISLVLATFEYKRNMQNACGDILRKFSFVGRCDSGFDFSSRIVALFAMLFRQ